MSPTNANVAESLGKVFVELSDVVTHDGVPLLCLQPSFEEVEVQAIDMAAKEKSVMSSFILKMLFALMEKLFLRTNASSIGCKLSTFF